MGLPKGMKEPLLSQVELYDSTSELEMYSKYVVAFFDSLDDIPSSVVSSRPEFTKLMEVRDRMKSLFEMNIK